MPPSPRSSILRASVVSAAGTGLSRVLGAVRDIAIGHVFGAGRSSDAFWVAWTIPSIFRRFVADEGLTGALIPAITTAEHERGAHEARRLAGAALAALVVVGVLICALGMLFAPWLVQLFAYGFARDPEKLALTIALTRWLFPFVVFVSLVSYCEGLLNHRGHFFVPKLAPGALSACMAASALLFATRFEEPIFALAVGVLAGGLAHVLMCVPPLVRHWGAPVPSFAAMRGARFRAFAREMGKVIAIGILAQVNVVMLRLLASLLEEGSVTHYWYANRVVDLAQGAIAVAVSSALLPAIASDAAEKNWEAFGEHFAEAVRLAAVVLVPVACMLAGMARPIVSVLFLHGAFDVAAAARTTATLRLLVPFMLALAGINIVKKAYFALDDRTTLLVVSVLGSLVTGGLGYWLSMRLGVEGLGAALSVSGFVQLVAYLVLLRRKMGSRIGLSRLAGPLVRITVAAVPAAAVAAFVQQLGDWEKGPASATNWGVLVLAGGLALSVYGVLGWVVRVPELRRLAARLQRRRHGV